MIKLYKKIAETPLQALQRLRTQRPSLQDARLSYAGRLDPMAAGLMPVLVGSENDNRRQYLGADKRYTGEMLFGIHTDTFDLLGKSELAISSIHPQEGEQKKPDSSGIRLSVNGKNFLLTENSLQSMADQYIGDQKFKYPPYSSKTVTLDTQKIPLWRVARADRLDEVEIPDRKVTIYDFDITGLRTVSKNYIINYIINYIGKLDGDFRQQGIITEWQKQLENAPKKFPLASIRVHCSSGTYIRRLVDAVGHKIDLRATLFSLLRTCVGRCGQR